jgi:hypothetical protein
MTGKFYILDGHTAVQLTGRNIAVRWARWFEKSRRVAFADLGYCTVSTVFLGIDHNFYGGPPLLFETLVFANPMPGDGFPDEIDGRMRRYSTWDEAEAGHDAMVAEVRRDFWRRANGP